MLAERQGITKVIGISHLTTMAVGTKCGNPSTRLNFISTQYFQPTNRPTVIVIPKAASMTKNASAFYLIFFMLHLTGLLQTSYLQPIADPKCQPGGGHPSVDKADLTLLQIIQGEQINGP